MSDKPEKHTHQYEGGYTLTYPENGKKWRLTARFCKQTTENGTCNSVEETIKEVVA